MPDTKITALAAITTVDPAADVLPIVDISDTSMAASGTTKKITSNQILGAGGTATLASATITGDLTVDTSTLKVDSANDRVGIKTATPRAGFALDVLGNVALGDSTTTTSNRLKLDCSGTAGNVAIMSFAAAGTNKAFYGLSGGFLGDTSTDAIVATDAAGAAIRFFVSDTGSEAMRLNANGLGVGVSPNTKLAVTHSDVVGTLYPIITAQYAAGTYGGMYAVRDGAGDQRGLAWQTYKSGTGLVESLRLSSDGNCGIGVTPSAWGRGKGLEVGSIGNGFWGDSGGNGIVSISANAYLSTADLITGWKYASTNPAGRYQISETTHSWYTAPSGTAGNDITFTERLRLKETGQLRFVPLASDPSGAEAGDVYYNSTSNKLKCYNGTTWNDLF